MKSQAKHKGRGFTQSDRAEANGIRQDDAVLNGYLIALQRPNPRSRAWLAKIAAIDARLTRGTKTRRNQGKPGTHEVKLQASEQAVLLAQRRDLQAKFDAAPSSAAGQRDALLEALPRLVQRYGVDALFAAGLPSQDIYAAMGVERPIDTSLVQFSGLVPAPQPGIELDLLLDRKTMLPLAAAVAP